MAGRPPLIENIKLVLRIHLDRQGGRSPGDLDNLIGGVCDGLMAAPPRARLHPEFDDPARADVAPSRCIAIGNDEAVVRIEAEKLFDAPREPWYEVTLEELTRNPWVGRQRTGRGGGGGS